MSLQILAINLTTGIILQLKMQINLSCLVLYKSLEHAILILNIPRLPNYGIRAVKACSFFFYNN